MGTPPWLGWDARKLFWVGIELDPTDHYGTPLARPILEKAFVGTGIVHREETLRDGTLIRVHFLGKFGPVITITDKDGRLVGFGVRVNEVADGRLLLGKANRVLGSLGIDLEAGIFEKWLGTVAEATGKEVMS